MHTSCTSGILESKSKEGTAQESKGDDDDQSNQGSYPKSVVGSDDKSEKHPKKGAHECD